MNSGTDAGTGANKGNRGETGPGQSSSVRWFGSWLPSIPAEVWIRVLFVFVALCLIKCGVLCLLREELFQTHWRINRRIGSEYPVWYGYLVFCALALILGVHLWLFGKRCASQGIKSVRWAFALLMVTSATFITLGMFGSGQSHVIPTVGAELPAAGHDSRFLRDVFFGPPYLAAWAGLLAGLYWYAVRTGREARVIQFFAVLAPLYLVVHLNELVHMQNQLLVLVVLGAAGLMVGTRSSPAVRWSLVAASCCLMASMFVLFCGTDSLIGPIRAEFRLVADVAIKLFIVGTIVAWRAGFLRPWSVLLLFLPPVFLVLVTDGFLLADNYRNLLVMGLGLPRYFIGEMFLAALLGAAAVLHLRWRREGSLLWMDLAGLFLIMVALLDFQLVRIMGIRMDWQVLSASDINSPAMLWRLAVPHLPMVGALLTGGLALYAGLLRWLGREQPAGVMVERVPAGSWRHVLTAALVLALAGAALLKPDKAQGQALTTLVKSGSWWKRLSPDKYTPEAFLTEVRELGLDTMLAPPPPPHRERRDLNVVVIFQESVFNKHLSLFGGTNDTQPLLARHRDRMEVFPNFHSNFAKSIHARFATFTGLYPVQEYQDFTCHPVPVKSLFEIMSEQDYECSMFYSSFFNYTNFRDFLRGRGLAKMYDADTMPGERKTERVVWGLQEAETLDAMREQIREYGQTGRKFFLSYVPACPHYPFDGVPGRFQQFRSAKPGDLLPHYLNELLYMDWVIDEILQELKAAELLDKTLVVITSDHGELTGDRDGLIGHGWLLDPELTNVPLIIMDPANRGFRVNPVAGSQVDLLPTIVDLLGLPMPSDQLYQGVSLYSPAAAEPRSIYLNSHRQFALLRQDFMVCGDRQMDEYHDEGVYRLTDIDGHFKFAPTETNAAAAADIARFDRFQENFLRHYEHYTRLFRAPAPGSVQYATQNR